MHDVSVFNLVLPDTLDADKKMALIALNYMHLRSPELIIFNSFQKGTKLLFKLDQMSCEAGHVACSFPASRTRVRRDCSNATGRPA